MRRNRDRGQLGVFLLINELIMNDRLPPVSLSVVIANICIYLELLNIRFPNLYEICMSANSVIKSKEYRRILFSAFFHADDWHLYYNMASFCMKGRSLEKRFGSVYFAILLFVFTIACGLVYIGLQYLAANMFDDSNHLSSCAVGFSGVLFALKVLTTHYLPDGAVYMFNMLYIPSKYVYWVELITISIVSPNASFAGHLAGIVVGLMYIYGPLKYLIDKIVPYNYHPNRRYRHTEYRNEDWRRANYGWRF